MSKETQEVDVLDQVKKIDKAVRAKLLIEKIALLKKYAREVNELKEKSMIVLEELGLSDKDMKRIIDYVNELPEVKLSERDKKDLRDGIHEEMSEEKNEVEKTLREVDLEKLIGSSTTSTWNMGEAYNCTSAGVGDGMGLSSSLFLANANNASYVATIRSGDDELEIKL